MPDLTTTCDSSRPSGPLLLAESIQFGYGHHNFLSIDRLGIEAGVFVGLVGPNGSGKSTLLRILAGLLRPRQGAVLLKGMPLAGLRPEERARNLAWVPQRSETPFEWTVREMVEAGRYPYLRRRLRSRTRDQEVIANSMAQVGLTELAQRPVSNLSGGEWQRALVARALAQEALVFLLDEPVANLDFRYQREIYELLLRLCRERGVTVLAADHHLDLQAHFCDRVVLLEQGRVKAQGPVEEIVNEELLESVFQTPVRVERSPITGRPLIRWWFGGEKHSPRLEKD